MYFPPANNENAVLTGKMTTHDLIALTDRFAELLATARRIDASGTPEERSIALIAMERVNKTLDQLQIVVDAWASSRR